MDMSAVDVGTVTGFVGLFLKSQQDKAKAAEALGTIKAELQHEAQRMLRYMKTNDWSTYYKLVELAQS